MKANKQFINENQIDFKKETIKSFEYEINFQNGKKSFIKKTFIILNDNNEIDIEKTIQYLYLQSQKNEIRLQYEYNAGIEKMLQEKLEFFSRQLLTDIDYFSNNQKSNIDYLKSIGINNSSSLEIETVLHVKQDKTIKNIAEGISHSTPAQKISNQGTIRNNISKKNQNFILFFSGLQNQEIKLENQRRALKRALCWMPNFKKLKKGKIKNKKSKIFLLEKINFIQKKNLSKEIITFFSLKKGLTQEKILELTGILFYLNGKLKTIKIEIKKNIEKYSKIIELCKSKKDLYTLFVQRKNKLIFA